MKDSGIGIIQYLRANGSISIRHTMERCYITPRRLGISVICDDNISGDISGDTADSIALIKLGCFFCGCCRKGFVYHGIRICPSCLEEIMTLFGHTKEG